jgi:ankyrin repeat protein
MTNRWLCGLLCVLPILCVASRRGEAQELAAFDHQLELFTRLAIEGKVAEAEVFLREPAFLRATDRKGHTALFAAAVAGNLEVLDLVLALSPQLDLCDTHGATALFYSAAGRTEVVGRLIQRGADINLPDQTGKSPLMVAVLMNHPDTVGLLLAAGADVNHRDHGGATALFYAAEAGLFEMAEQLVKGGADSQLSDNRGLTPRQVGEAKSFPKIVDLFLRK